MRADAGSRAEIGAGGAMVPSSTIQRNVNRPVRATFAAAAIASTTMTVRLQFSGERVEFSDHRGRRPMLRRCLNIASVVCLAASVALVAFSVRSYYRAYDMRGRLRDGRSFAAVVMQGRLMVVVSSTTDWSWEFNRYSIQQSMGFPNELKRPAFPGVGWDYPMPGVFRALIPLWPMALVIGLPIMILQIRRPWQFTLRTLFVVTTLLAIVLAMIVRLK
jgi:hypothetical protein